MVLLQQLYALERIAVTIVGIRYSLVPTTVIRNYRRCIRSYFLNKKKPFIIQQKLYVFSQFANFKAFLCAFTIITVPITKVRPQCILQTKKSPLFDAKILANYIKVWQTFYKLPNPFLVQHSATHRLDCYLNKKRTIGFYLK